MLFKPAVRPNRRWSVTLGIVLSLAPVFIAYGSEQVLRDEDEAKTNAGTLHVDALIQQIAENSLDSALEKYEARAGFVIIGDPQTGRVLAVANKVTEGPAGGTTPHWALSLRVEPASTMKAFVAAAALEHGKTRWDEVHNCEKGHYVIDGHEFGDWKGEGFDKLTTAETVIMSSNICGIKVAQRLGADGLTQALTDFGFGAGGSTKDFPEARAGLVIRRSDITPDFFTATVGTGYAGIRLSPLEVVQAFAAFANEGKLMKPLAADAPDSAIHKERQVISPDTARRMKIILEDVVKHGTGTTIRKGLYRFAGKTSTAYAPDFPEHSTLGGEAQVAGFAGFAPFDKPRIVAYVGVFDPKDHKDHSAHGASHAAPLFRDVAEKVLLHMHVAPDK